MFYQATMRQRARLHCRLISVKDPDDYPRKTGLKLNNKSEIFNEILYVNDAARKTLFAFHTAHLCGVRIRPGRNQPFSARCNKARSFACRALGDFKRWTAIYLLFAARSEIPRHAVVSADARIQRGGCAVYLQPDA